MDKIKKILIYAAVQTFTLLPTGLMGGCETKNGSEVPEVLQWVAFELAFKANTNFEVQEKNPLDYELDVTFESENGTQITVPGFWDGADEWKARFAPTETGNWTYVTKFTDAGDSGLHNKTGSFICIPYDGSLEIYKRGFLKADRDKKYFTYADGSPFFYLGDTHWSMPGEPFDTMFKSIVDDRAKKGFTVYQSEPIGAQYNPADGLDDLALDGFRDLDRRFQYIAEKGIIHANAQLFFAAEIMRKANRENYSDEYLRQLARYWVARYAAYPVMWTTAQEADKDFYYSRGDSEFGADDNPWHIVFNAIHQYDPYNHPHTAHQENTTSTRANDSSFKDLPGHDWFAAQWSPSLNSQLDFNVAKEYWNSGKISVNYEGRYENLWTKEFGARVQGWTAYLNGMFGYGYGAADIWLYNSAYDVNTTSNDGIDKITPEDKAVKWDESINFNTSFQLGYMKNFFYDLEWWKLIPRFDDANFFIPDKRAFYCAASDENNSLIVIYFYNIKNKNTGTVTGLSDDVYSLVWFDPCGNEYMPEIEITPSGGSYETGEKPYEGDCVLLLKKK